MYQSDEDGGAGAGRVPHSVREKLSAEFGLRDESACLAVNGVKRRASREAAASASGDCFKFHRREDRRAVGKTEISQIFAFKVQPDSLSDIGSQFVQRGRLRDHRQVRRANVAL